MSYQNAFTGGKDQASAAAKSAKTIHQDEIPGAVSPDVDPELYDGIQPGKRDPKIVNELSPAALTIAGEFLAPLFTDFQAVAADQLAVSENPATTSTMASSSEQEVARHMTAEVEDSPKPPAEDTPKDPVVAVPKKPPPPAE